MGGWQTATVVALRDETPRARTYRLRLSVPERHRAGQHYVVRLTAPDGYSAQRSYSVASPPDDSGEIDLTVERLDHGEVSTFLHDEVAAGDELEVAAGDELEVRGPIGGWFVWDDGPARPVADEVTAYVCGSTRFADPASRLVVDAGVPVERVRVERFGPTG